MIAKVFKTGNSMALRLPRELNPKAGEVSIERAGNCWLVEPVKPAKWPAGFFERIEIKSAAFKRATQGAHRSVRL